MLRWVILVLVVVVDAAAQARQLAPLPVEAAIAARTFSTTPFSLSNDSQLLAYALSDPKRSQLISDERHRWLTPTGAPPPQIGTDIWVTNIRTRQTRNLTEGTGSNWAPSWSPDSNYLAFFSDRSGIATLWIWERSSEQLRQVSDLPVVGYKGLSVPRWTPDSKSILFCALPDGMTIEKAALLSIGLEQDRPEPRSSKHDEPTVTVFRSSAQKPGAVSEVTKIKSLSSVYDNGYSADLVMVDVAGSRVRRLVKGAKPCAYWPSPDGTHVVFTSVRGDGSQSKFDLIAVSLRDNTQTLLATELQQGFVAFSVSWSPDSATLSYTTLEPGSQPRRECYLISMDGTQRRKVTGTPAAGFSNPLRAPLWDKTGTSLYLLGGGSLWRVTTTNATATEVVRSPNRRLVDIVPATTGRQFWSPDDGNSLLVVTSDPDSLRVGFSRVNLANGQLTTVVEEDKVYGGGNFLLPAAQGTVDGRSLVFICEDAGHSPDFWTFEGNLRKPQRLTTINQEFDKYVMGTSTLIEWRGPNGETLRGALLLPAGYQKGKRYPLVVSQYPDEALSNYVNFFGLKSNLAADAVNNRQLLATRGYAVLLADSRMKVGNPLHEIVGTVIPGVNKVIEMGIADPERLGIIGHSHGGYGVLGVVTQVQRFKAAVCWAGSGNLVSMYGQMDSDGSSHWIDWAETGFGSVGGSLWEVRERYLENSPIFYLDQVKTPLLIVQGGSDRITTPNHSEEIFVGLRRLGKEVEYARYEGEDHAFWFYPNRVDFCNRVIEWFDRWLKPQKGT
ncbi:MAG TPA: prolyl oligopeptidase family serine peptidase [Pyrinomonadaceae bacterium]|nr:prolyl oligopeptidase family serine peptidase [Pyrinomonadaceae bacterium]